MTGSKWRCARYPRVPELTSTRLLPSIFTTYVARSRHAVHLSAPNSMDNGTDKWPPHPIAYASLHALEQPESSKRAAQCSPSTSARR